jgi:membrane-associated phospholipid phosphatase
MKKWWFWGLWLSLGAQAQEVSPKRPWLHPEYRLGSYLQGTLTDARQLLIAPLKWEKREWRQSLTITAGLIGSAYLFDRQFEDVLIRPVVPSNWYTLTDAAGNGLIHLPLTGLVWLHGKWRHLPDQQLLAMNAAKAFVLSRLLVQIPKYLLQRERPLNSPDDPFRLHGPWGNYTQTSFPSGHTSSAFAAAASLRHSHHGQYSWLVGGMYVLAVGTAAGRVSQQKHWLSDVVGGALLGEIIGYYISRKGTSSFSIGQQGGLAFSF